MYFVYSYEYIVQHALKNAVLVDGTKDGGALFGVELEFVPATSPWTNGLRFGACSFNFILGKEKRVSLLNKCYHKVLNVLVIT